MTTTPPFPLLGEPLALDLVNTRVHQRGAGVDLLGTPAALDAWLRAERGRIAWSGRTGTGDLAALRALREAISELVRAARLGTRPAARTVIALNRALANPAATPRLAWGDRGARLTRPRLRAQRAALLHAIATDALTLLTGPDGGRIRECAHPDCVLQFVARNPRRRWCSSALCGNRARVARHYQLQRGAP